jgi:hypothetical protein
MFLDFMGKESVSGQMAGIPHPFIQIEAFLGVQNYIPGMPWRQLLRIDNIVLNPIICSSL